MTAANFGFGDAVFAVNKNKHGLLEDINKEIQKMQDSMDMKEYVKNILKMNTLIFVFYKHNYTIH